MPEPRSCGEALTRLLGRYGVDTVFGIPGVHTLDLYRGFHNSGIRHVLARHEQGAGFMADGYARVSGKPGVCLLISGPGVTNAATALGQAYADSVPVLLISSVTASYTHGKGWGCLHEITDQRAVTAPLTAFSAVASSPEDLPELIGQAFTVFASRRPRPVHIAIPIDVLAQSTASEWKVRTPPTRPRPNAVAVRAAAGVLQRARLPVIVAGGGAIASGNMLTQLAERLDAAVITTNAGKGVVPESHRLSLGASLVRPEVQEFIAAADVVLAVGTELAETDSFIEKLPINGTLIRIDIDPAKINDLYPAEIGIVADAGDSAELLVDALAAFGAPIAKPEVADQVAATRARMMSALTASETQHVALLRALREVLPHDAVMMGDIAQLVYTGSFAMPVERPRLWHYPAGFCTLGCGLPNAIGAKLALPDRPVMALAGDGGFMFTAQELVSAAELRLAVPIVVWTNGGFKQIRDDMKARDIPAIGVNGLNPDFVALARACCCYGVRPDSRTAFQQAVGDALQADAPTLIEVAEGTPWLRA